MTLQLDARAVPYVASPQMDSTWAELASRYGLSVAELAAANPGHAVADDGHTRFTRQEFVMIPVREALRAYDYIEVDGRAAPPDVVNLRDFVAWVRRDPRRPIASLDVRFLWEHPLHAQHRRAIVRRVLPGVRFGTSRMQALDADPSGVELLAETWAIPVPRRPLQAPARVPADLQARVRVEPGWAVRIEHEHVPAIRRAAERLARVLQDCESIIADARSLRAWCVRLDGVLKVCETVQAAQAARSAHQPHDGNALWPLRRALDDALREVVPLTPDATVDRLHSSLGLRRDAAAQQLWAELMEPRFRDDVRAMMRDDPAIAPRARAMAAVAQVNGLGLIARVASMRPQLERLLDSLVDRIATVPRAQADGENALVVTACVAWERAHGDSIAPAEAEPPDWTAAAADLWSTTQSWVLPLTGNLPGPPSVMGAVLNLYATHLIDEIGGPAPSVSAAERRILGAVSRAAVLSSEHRRDLAVLLDDLARGQQSLAADRRNDLLRQLSSTFQAGPRWTKLYGVLGAVGLFLQLRQLAGVQRNVDGAVTVTQAVAGHLVLLSAIFQYAGYRSGAPLQSSTRIIAAGGVAGTAAAVVGTLANFIRLGNAIRTNTDGSNPVAVLSTGVAFVAGLMSMAEAGVLVLLGVGLSIAGSWLVERIADSVTRLPPPARYFQLAARYPASVASNDQDPIGRTVKRLRGEDDSSSFERALRAMTENVERMPAAAFPILRRETTITIAGQTRTVGQALTMLGVTDGDALAALLGD